MLKLVTFYSIEKKLKQIPKKSLDNYFNKLSVVKIDLTELLFDRPFRIHKSLNASVAWLLLFEIITKL